MSGRNPKRNFAIAGLVCVGGLVFVGWRLNLHPLWAYLGAVSIVTFLFYGYDKRQSRSGGGRVPEVVLHLLALSGGTCGALAGQAVFRHKTREVSFNLVLAGIIIIQAAGIAVYFIVVSREFDGFG